MWLMFKNVKLLSNFLLRKTTQIFELFSLRAKATYFRP